MTEYDYSPEAYERHIAKQHSIAKWVDHTAQCTQVSPRASFTKPRSPPPPHRMRSRSRSSSSSSSGSGSSDTASDDGDYRSRQQRDLHRREPDYFSQQHYHAPAQRPQTAHPAYQPSPSHSTSRRQSSIRVPQTPHISQSRTSYPPGLRSAPVGAGPQGTNYRAPSQQVFHDSRRREYVTSPQANPPPPYIYAPKPAAPMVYASKASPIIYAPKPTYTPQPSPLIYTPLSHSHSQSTRASRASATHPKIIYVDPAPSSRTSRRPDVLVRRRSSRAGYY